MTILFVVLLLGLVAVSLGIAAIVIHNLAQPEQPEHQGADESYAQELLDTRRHVITGDDETLVIDPVQAGPMAYPHFPDLPPFDEGLLSFTHMWKRGELDEKIARAEEQARQAGLVTR